ncbi:PilZ domain-containing protein [Alteromonas sp. ALT199]|uniref:PilZ domain-containing protein n=1 Tax=unclassified Alteromonas TaxID=2614992 RepID=UPI001BE79B12|nr:PilZ domain-containing protein [Alteromonas sp. ALT199]MBT3135185.1 PilZ domain-containing protein [Alteromonas sp. ALT199]
MDISLLLNMVATAVIVITFSIVRFNAWPRESLAGIKGKPSDFISVKRFLAFFSLYVLSVLLMILVLHGIPELANYPAISHLFSGLNMPENGDSYAFWALAVVCLVSVPPLKKYEEDWRNRLHMLARIPRDVMELRSRINSVDRFTPSAFYYRIAKEQIAEAGKEFSPQFSLLEQRWLEYLENFEEEKRKGSIFWYFLNCVYMLTVAKQTCSYRILGSTESTERKLQDLGSLIITRDGQESSNYRKELKDIIEFLEVCICKSVVKKHENLTDRIQALESYGFKTNHDDCFRPKLASSFFVCGVYVAFVSVVSVLMIQQVLANSSPVPVTVERFFTWSLGSLLSFLLSIFAAAVVASFEGRRGNVNQAAAMLVCLVLSTLASAIYFIVVNELHVRSESNPIARTTLALSFGLLSPIVYRAIVTSTLDPSDLKRFAVVNGLTLGVALAFMQCAVSYTFNMNTTAPYVSIMHFFTAQENKMAYMAAIGFMKGASLGLFISFFIQHTKRSQLLKSLRQFPRKEVEIPVRLSESGPPALVLDISQAGMKITAQTLHNVGDKVKVEIFNGGTIDALVRWTKRKSRRRFEVGLLVPCHNVPTQNFLLQEGL